jgi:hypothetical protein
MKARRQVGGSYLAGVRGAFSGGQARLRRRVGVPANPEPNGATRATGARNGGRFLRKPRRISNVGLPGRSPQTQHQFAGPEIDRRRPRVEMVRNVAASEQIK